MEMRWLPHHPVGRTQNLAGLLLPALRPAQNAADTGKIGGTLTRPPSRIRPLIRKDYPLSLSISLSGGEETNQDFPSNGERTGKSPA
jgi:hypothetical protein